MEYATTKQIALIERLCAQRGSSVIAAIEEYGLGLRSARDLTASDASDLIDWLRGRPINAGVNRDSEAYKAGREKADQNAAEFVRKYPHLR